MFQINVGLLVFNFLPIPPLDGSRLLPRSLDSLQAAIAPYSFVLLLIVINVPILSEYMVSRPVRLVMKLLKGIFRRRSALHSS